MPEEKNYIQVLKMNWTGRVEKKELKKEIKATKAKISKQEGKLKKLKKKLKKA